MSTGTAILLSALVLSVTMIVIGTRDRVRWGRWLLFSFLGVLLIGSAIGIYAYIVTSYAWNREVASEVDDIKLGDSLSDVRFRKGPYQMKCFLDGSKDNVELIYRDGYETSKKWLVTEFRGDRAVRISLSGDISYSAPTHNNYLMNYDTERTLREKWGDEDFVRQDDEATRYYVYRRYNFATSLKDNRVNGVVVFDPSLFFLDSKAPPKRHVECYDANGKKTL